MRGLIYVSRSTVDLKIKTGRLYKVYEGTRPVELRVETAQRPGFVFDAVGKP